MAMRRRVGWWAPGVLLAVVLFLVVPVPCGGAAASRWDPGGAGVATSASCCYDNNKIA